MHGCDHSAPPPPPNAQAKPERITVRAADVIAGLRQSESTTAAEPAPIQPSANESASDAIGPDHDYAGEEQVESAFLVYRAQLRVPVIQGFVSRVSYRPTAELHVWSSSERLRAKFVGNAWPVGDGAEVRLRADRPGAVVVDASGMRPLGPGQLAHWFAGTSLTQRVHANAAIAMVSEKEAGGPRHLLCELIAEWTNQPRTNLEPRCSVAGPNPRLRIGQWWATRTVSMYQSLPKRRLRTDQPLTEPVKGDFQAIQSRPSAGQHVINQYAKRLLPFAGGQPWGWVDPGEGLEDAPCLKNVRAAVDAFGNVLRAAALRHEDTSQCFEAFAPRPLRPPPILAAQGKDASSTRQSSQRDASTPTGTPEH